MVSSENTEGSITRLPDGSCEVVAFEEGKPDNVKRFVNKKIYLPSEEEAFTVNEVVYGLDVIWLGITGWTKPPTYYAERYGTCPEKGIYEKLATALILESASTLVQNGFRVDLRHGASNAGVDAAVMKAMELTGISGSGLNCPAYMPWVEDSNRGGAVFVAASKEDYHAAYSRLQKILLVTGGREAAFYHDYLKRMSGEGFSIVSDLIQIVSKELVPGFDIPPGKDKPQLGNAAAYVREKNSFYGNVPRTYDELMATTKFLILNAAYKVSNREPDQKALSYLECKISDAHKDWQKGNNHIITIPEVDERILAAVKEYKVHQ